MLVVFCVSREQMHWSQGSLAPHCTDLSTTQQGGQTHTLWHRRAHGIWEAAHTHPLHVLAQLSQALPLIIFTHIWEGQFCIFLRLCVSITIADTYYYKSYCIIFDTRNSKASKLSMWSKLLKNLLYVHYLLDAFCCLIDSLYFFLPSKSPFSNILKCPPFRLWCTSFCCEIFTDFCRVNVL